MTSLGLLGDYGSASSASEISDSDDDRGPASVSDNSIQEQQLETQNFAPTPVHKSNSNTNSDPLNFAQTADSSSSEDEASEGSKLKDATFAEEKAAISLPLPDLDQLSRPSSATGSVSVFSNPFKEAEEAKLAMLKRHVSEFAPDEKPSSRYRTKYRKGQGARHGRGFSEATPTGDAEHLGLFKEDDSPSSDSAGERKRKQRSGVSGTLVPPKKFLKCYENTQAKERPWTVRTSKT